MKKGNAVQLNYQINYDWSLVVDQNGVIRYSGNNAHINDINATIDELLITAIEKPAGEVEEFELFQNYPNPFNPETRIRFNLDKAQYIELKIFDIRGRLVKILYSGFLETGFHQFLWNSLERNGQLAASGMYVYRLSGELKQRIGKMILSR